MPKNGEPTATGHRALATAWLAAALLLATAVPAAAGVLFNAPFLSFDVSRSPSSVVSQDLNGDGHPDLVVADYYSDAVSVLLGNGDMTFGPRTDYVTGRNPQTVALGDVDGDGRADLVVANYGGNTISVLLGNGDGTFRAKTDFTAGSLPQHLALADLNHDGHLDVAVTDRGSNTVAVLLGNGDGSFGPRTEYATGSAPLWVAIGLVNADAHPDLVVANNGSGTVSVLLGFGDGTFHSKTDFPAGAAPRALGLADLDGDGQLDLAVANSTTSTVTALPGRGDGTFGAGTGYPVGANPQCVAIADLNHDGHPDLVTADYSANTVSVLLGYGNGAFAPRTDVRAGNQPNALAIGDLDGDGDQDLAVTAWFTWDFATVATLRGHGDGTFGAQLHLATGTDPWAVVSGDLNRDGHPDLVSANYSSNTVSVLLGNGDATFSSRTDFATGTNPASIALGDVNADGRLDLAVANRGANTISVLLGNGDGTFAAKHDFATGTNPLSVALGDVNGDGWPDLAAADRGSGKVSVLLGNGDGTFGPKTDYTTGADPFGVAIGDLDGDLKPDLAVVNSSSNTVSVLLGNGDGSFRPRTDYATGGQPYSVAIADLNGDGRPDLTVADRGTNAVSVLLGNGDGTFAPHADYHAGLFPQTVVVADLDGDGHPDLAVANEQSHSVSVLLGHGDGTFAAKSDYGAGTYARALAAVDVNTDQALDLVVACFSLNTLTVLLNAVPPPMANPVTVGPAAGPISFQDTCVIVPVTIQRTTGDALRGFSATVGLSPNLRLCAARADEGGYLSAVNPNVHLGVVDHGAGVYTIDGAILGTPCGAVAPTGTLFNLHVASDSAGGTGRVTLSAITLRDCGNAVVPSRVAPPGSTTIAILPPPNPVALGAPSGCITNVDTCIALPVTIARTTADPLLGFSMRLQLSPSLRLGGPRGTEGGYFSSYNPANQLQVRDLGNGLVSVDCVILGPPCGPSAPGGTLFLLHLASAAGGDSGTVTPVSILLRDCDNHPVASSVGAGRTVMIDAAYPDTIAHLAATRQPPAGAVTSPIALGWTAPASGLTVELYRAGFGAYPEYDDGGGSVPAKPGWPPDARWVHLATLPGGNSYEDTPQQRDVYYYAAFARDACGSASLAAMTSGTLDYALGDVSDGVTECQGNGGFGADDASLFGSHYGATLGPGSQYACLDIGPTTDGSVNGRPTTDDVLDFEDLMILSLSYQPALVPQPGPVLFDRDMLALEAPSSVTAGQLFAVTLRFRGAGDLQGLSTRIAWDANMAEQVDFSSGGLAESQGGVVFLGRSGAVDAALLGVRQPGLGGDGVLATVTFRALASGNPGIGLAGLEGRDANNRRATPAGRENGTPAITFLAPAAPNPARGASTLAFGLAHPGPVALEIFSVDGRKVRTLLRETKDAGTYRPIWTGTDDQGRTVRPGCYYARLTTPDGRYTRVVVLMR